VLLRYGPENYFSQSAMEAEVGRELSSAFPLSEILRIDQCIPGYGKALNGRVAERMSPDDLRGTDLGEILKTVVKRSVY
jgi:hypothetical protein